MGHIYVNTNMTMYDMITQLYPNFNAGLPRLFFELEHVSIIAFLSLIYWKILWFNEKQTADMDKYGCGIDDILWRFCPVNYLVWKQNFPSGSNGEIVGAVYSTNTDN